MLHKVHRSIQVNSETKKQKKAFSYLKPNQLTKSIIYKDLILRPSLVYYKKLHKTRILALDMITQQFQKLLYFSFSK